MPSAVRVLRNVTLSDGTIMPELLVVQDRSLLFENIGATQELSRSVREQRTMLGSLSETLAYHMHEMGEKTKRVGILMNNMVQFMLTEKKDNYETSCFFLSIFGLGPSWTMYLLGFFLPVLWFFGLFYIASVATVKKVAGWVHLITLMLYVVYASVVLSRGPLVNRLVALFMVQVFGIVLFIIFFLFWQSKRNHREHERHQAIVRGYTAVAETIEAGHAISTNSNVNRFSRASSSSSGEEITEEKGPERVLIQS